MTGREMLFDMVRTANQAVLDEYNVRLTLTDLEFTGLTAGEFEGGANTKITAISHHPHVYGRNTYYYTRPDLTEVFKQAGYDEPRVFINGTVNVATVMNALKQNYNLWVPLEDVENLKVEDGLVSFDVVESSYVWTGGLRLTVDNQTLKLEEEFTFNVLNGLTARKETPVTDGGNYDQLTGNV